MTLQKFLTQAQLAGIALLLASSLTLASCAKTPEPPLPQPDAEVIEVPAESPPLGTSEGTSEGTSDAAPDATSDPSAEGSENAALPAAVEAAIFQDIASRQQVPVKALKVTAAQAKSWPDGCLGLGGPAEICTFAIVEGWEVTVSQGDNQWLYRSDSEGLSVRLANN
jgi:hypothetical protein